MRRALLVFALAALAVMACAQTVLRETTVVVAWDTPAGTAAGDPLLPDDVVTYRVWIEDLICGTSTMVAEVTALESGVTVPYRSVWRIGVSAVLDGQESGVAWSTMAEDVEGGLTFVLRPKGIAAKLGGVHPK